MAAPTVTIVVVPRERFSYTRRTLESIYRHTDYPFELVCVDGNSPPRVAASLRKASGGKGFRLIRTDAFLSPNQARNIGARDVDSTYVVFADNDIEVEPGWLEHLVACAERTGAWAVAPLYFEGRPGSGIIHVAGGSADLGEVDGVRVFEADHRFAKQPYADVSAQLREEPVGLFEFHCVLMRRAAMRTLGPFDEGYLSNQEHLDFSLLIRRAGGTVYFNPRARVTYTYAATLLDRFDIEYASLRWSEDWNQRSLRHFVEKWGIDASCAWPADSETWANRHRQYLLNRQRGVARVCKSAVKALVPGRLYSALGAAADRLRAGQGRTGRSSAGSRLPTPTR